MLSRIGWHQVGSRIRLKVVITKLPGQAWPPSATLILNRGGYSADAAIGPFIIPDGLSDDESVSLKSNQPFEITAEGHYTILLRLGNETREIVRFNGLPARLALVGISAALFAFIAAVAGVLTLPSGD